MTSTFSLPARAGALLCTTTLLVGLASLPAADAVVKPRVRWSDSSVHVGTKVTATVDPDTRPRGSRLVLQRKDLDGWRTVEGRAEHTDRGLVLRVPTGQLGRFRFRVAARDEGRTRSSSSTEHVRVRPSYDPAGRARDHTFLGNRRFRWDPCGRVRWAFNPAHARRHALDQVRTTIRKAREATGLPFRYAGITHRTPTLKPHQGSFEIIVGWRRPRSFAYFADHPNRVGVGGATWRSGFEEANGTRVHKAFSGRLILNARYDGDLERGYGRGSTWGDVLLHEFGHVLGLGHTDARGQQMYPEITRHRARWGAGDLAGLHKLGRTRGCLERTHERERGHSNRH